MNNMSFNSSNEICRAGTMMEQQAGKGGALVALHAIIVLSQDNQVVQYTTLKILGYLGVEERIVLYDLIR